MKLHFVSALFLASAANAFVTPRGAIVSRSGDLRMSTTDDIEALRAKAAKARADAERLSKELGKPMVDEAKTAVPAQKNTLSKKELEGRLSSISFDANNAGSQIAELEALRKEGSLSLYKSASVRTFPVSLSMLESRTQISLETFGFGDSSGEMVSLDDFKYSTLAVVGGSTILGVLSLAVLPPNIGATACYLFALIPILYIGIGSVAPAAIAQVIDGVKNRNQEDRVKENDRIARHEAAHFVCGYLCGLPIVDYQLLDSGVPCVEFSAGGQDRFSKEEVASLSVTALSGLVAEAMEFGDVRGAENDLAELQTVFRQAQDFIGAQQQQDLTRWGALQAFLLLKEHKGKVDQVCEAFQQQKSVSECIAMLES